MRIVKYVFTLLVSGFLYRPIMFYLVPAVIATMSGRARPWHEGLGSA